VQLSVGSDALENLQRGDLDGCALALKALLDEIRQNMDTDDVGAG
jgi:phage head maturation protease